MLIACLLWASAAGATAKRQRHHRHHRHHRHLATFPKDYATAPSYRYANLTAAACYRQLDHRKIHYRRVAQARGVLAPVRISKGVDGVLFHTALPRAAGRKSPWEIFDCRLVLALHDYAAILRTHGIDEVIIFSAWRPPSRKWPAGKLARRHPGALAVDMYRFHQRLEPPSKPGANSTPTKPAPAPAASVAAETHSAAAPSFRWLEVERDFHGRIGAKLCGPEAPAPAPDNEAARTLRSLVCEAASARFFTSMLTPNYNRPHGNHFHFELTPAVKWRLLE